MRIISGKYKGKKIFHPLDNFTRPLKDLTKESIFNIIKHSNKFRINFINSHILDLFSGVGSFGIECISRDVNKVIFVERNSTAFNVLKKNVLSLKLSGKVELKYLDIKNYLENLEENNKFDLFFLDPPYRDNSYIEIIKLIKKKGIFSKNHLVVIHREKSCEDEINKILKVNLLKSYGRSKIIFGSF